MSALNLNYHVDRELLHELVSMINELKNHYELALHLDDTTPKEVLKSFWDNVRDLEVDLEALLEEKNNDD